MIKVTYDAEAHAAYIYFQEPGVEVARTYLCDPKEIGGMINIDFDKSGKIIGIEVLDAEPFLNKDILDLAKT